MNNDRKNNWIVGIVVFILVFLLFKSCGGCLGCTGCAAAGCAAGVPGGCSVDYDNNSGNNNNNTPVQTDYGIDLVAKDELYVNDYTDTLTDADKSAIVRTGEQLEAANGVQLVVVMINDKELLGNDELSDFTYRLFNQWGVGDSSTNKGLLLVINIAKDTYIGNAYCVEGTGLENLLPASELGSIIDAKVLPNLDERKFALAATEGYFALAARVTEVYGGSDAAD